MLFNSVTYAIFLPLVLLLYRLLRGKVRERNAMLLAASYLFYGWWDVRFLYLIVLSTVVDYSSAIMIDKGRLTKNQRIGASSALLLGCVLFVVPQWGEPDLFPATLGAWIPLGAAVAWVITCLALYPRFARLDAATRRKFFVTFSVVVNLAILATFKYFNFFAENLEAAVGVELSDWTMNIVLPVGISFYTFQTMSYTIDVYRKDLRASESMLTVATYVAFFPQLVAGPIERGAHLLPQFDEVRPRLSREERASALWLIAWGLFKKVVVADNMSVLVNRTFAPFDELGSLAVVPDDGLRLLIGVYAFALQIYGDFSGYTDIARGSAKLLGFDLMLNFKLPYFAVDPSDFWRRWHISLSTWLRDYLYIPLGGNRGGTFYTYRNLCITMLLGGLWHGAAWTFVIWGAYHGLLLVVFRIVLGRNPKKRSLPGRIIQGAIFFQFTCLGWLIFRAQNVGTISGFLTGIFSSPGWSAQCTSDAKDLLFYSWFLMLFQIVQGVTGRLEPLAAAHWFVRLNVWFYVIFSSLVLAYDGEVEFIYFAF